ncbi:MAG: hypothetical protein EXS32_05370 [Opitutus sp.]|nr:hypothetical protein [Opitutus sp.]
MSTRHFLPSLLVALLASSSALAAAQEPNTPAAAAAPAAAPGTPALPGDASKLADKPAASDSTAKPEDAAKGVATKGKDATGKDTLSVDFPDEDIRNILRNVADLFELNLVMPEALQGKTSIKLRDVTWRQIFQNVLGPVNYTAVEEGNIIKIVTNDSLTQEPVTTEVFLINYAKAADIMPTITSLVEAASGGKIMVDVRSNSLVITERPTRMQRIKQIVEQLDKATDQVMIESKFIEVTNSDVRNLGVNWSSLQNFNLSAGPLTGNISRTRGQTEADGFDRSKGSTGTNTTGTNASNTVTTSGTTSGGSNTTSSVTSANGSPTATSTTGTNGALTNGTTTTGVTGTTGTVSDTLNSTLNFLNNVANNGGTSRALQSVFNADQFKLVLSALQSQNDVKIVSNPTIVTLNNTEASINVGESNPIPKYQYNQQTGGFEVAGFDYKDIGINLKVTPQVNGRGTIKLTLSPEVSQKNGTATFGIAQIPIIATRKATTTIMLKDGFTMGIGGMLTTQSTKVNTKVPLFGSIPGLGRLFRSDSKDEQVRNLIIFITAKTVPAEGAPVEMLFESERVRQLNIKREDLPGYRDGSSPFQPSTAKPGESKTGETPPAKKPFFRLTTPEDKK